LARAINRGGRAGHGDHGKESFSGGKQEIRNGTLIGTYVQSFGKDGKAKGALGTRWKVPSTGGIGIQISAG
jgi:hypothetical protein